MKAYHECPAPNCSVQVLNSTLACRSHWFMLSERTRQRVWETHLLSIVHPDRLAALTAATEEWVAKL